jgi:hypothetical protein
MLCLSKILEMSYNFIIWNRGSSLVVSVLFAAASTTVYNGGFDIVIVSLNWPALYWDSVLAQSHWSRVGQPELSDHEMNDNETERNRSRSVWMLGTDAAKWMRGWGERERLKNSHGSNIQSTKKENGGITQTEKTEERSYM